MEGVAVWTNYQLNSIKGFVTTNKQYTDKYGIVNLKLTNTEYQESLTETEYTLFVEYMGEQQSHKIDAESGRRSRTYYINISQVTIRVFDEYKGGLKANVTILNTTKATGSGGFTFFNLPKGDYEAIIDYTNSNETYQFTMEGEDILIEIPLTEYELNVSFVDDKGNPLDGIIKVADKTKEVENGFVNIKFTAIPPIIIEGTAENKVVTKEIDPKLVKITTLSFDIHGPEISGVSQVKTDKGYDLVFNIEDTGQFATGVDTKINPPKFSYYIIKNEQKGQEKVLTLLKDGETQYRVTLTDITDDSVINYEITATDLNANEVKYSNSFLATAPIGPVIQNQSKPDPDPIVREEWSLSEVFKWVLVGLGIVVFILIVYTIFKLKKEAKKEKD
jgi:hypothetical protein